jgi:hypothetical protein
VDPNNESLKDAKYLAITTDYVSEISFSLSSSIGNVLPVRVLVRTSDDAFKSESEVTSSEIGTPDKDAMIMHRSE